jgi:hypothetical protein
VERVGRLLAAEARRKGVDVLLAPTVNLHRSPHGGRHFECFGEDPLLTARIGVAYVRGLQAGGVGAAVKHFVANDSETDRFSVDVRVDERALRELYLPPFEAIVEAGVWAVMAAYNSVNGATMTEHPMLREVLKDEWGFDGVVMSDWFAARSTEPAANAGLDLVMPGPGGPLGRQAGRRRPCRSGRRGDRRRQGHAAAAAGRRVGGLDGVEPAAPTAEPWPEAARGPGVRVDHGRGGRSTDRLPVAPATLLRHPETGRAGLEVRFLAADGRVLGREAAMRSSVPPPANGSPPRSGSRLEPSSTGRSPTTPGAQSPAPSGDSRPVRDGPAARRRCRGHPAAPGGPPAEPRRRGVAGSGAAGPWAATGDVAAADPAVGVGSQLPLQLHQAPDLGAVDPEIGLDVGGRLPDVVEVDAEQLGAPLQRGRDRAGQGGVVRFPGLHAR